MYTLHLITEYSLKDIFEDLMYDNMEREKTRKFYKDREGKTRER